jgi:hypothetical protein
MFESNSSVVYANVGNIKPANMAIRKGWIFNMKGIRDMD